MLLHLLESRVDPSRVESLLAVRDSKGRGLLHLAAKDHNSSTAVKLLLDCGVKVKFSSYEVTGVQGCQNIVVVQTAVTALFTGKHSCFMYEYNRVVNVLEYAPQGMSADVDEKKK